MQQNPADDRRNLDPALFQGWSLALDYLSLPPVTARDLPRLFTLSKLTATLQLEIQSLNEIAQELSTESKKWELDIVIREAQSFVPKASALYAAISQMSEGQYKTALQETGQIILGCIKSAQSSASLLLNVIEEEENIAEAPRPINSEISVASSVYSNGDLTPEGKHQNVTIALALMTQLLEEVRQETVSATVDSSDPIDSQITLSPSVSLAVSRLSILLQQDPELPHRITKEFVTTAFQCSEDPERSAEVLTTILSLFQRFKDTSLQWGNFLRTANALATQSEKTTDALVSVLKGEPTTEPNRPSKSNLISIIRSNVETCSGGLERLDRLLDCSIASSS